MTPLGLLIRTTLFVYLIAAAGFVASWSGIL